jgi:circadian clock protein KaiB
MKEKRPEDSFAEFEKRADSRRTVRQLLRLYVAGNTPCSLRALGNLKRLCNTHLPGGYRLEVIDVHQHPELAKAAQIVALPTLVRSRPSPLRRIIGDFSDEGRFCSSLGLTTA